MKRQRAASQLGVMRSILLQGLPPVLLKILPCASQAAPPSVPPVDLSSGGGSEEMKICFSNKHVW